MAPWLQTMLTIVATIFASSGFWAWIMARRDKKDAKTLMILGLGHDRLKILCKEHLEKGYISQDDYKDLDDYLYQPYISMGGNGSVKRSMAQVANLPHYPQQVQQP